MNGIVRIFIVSDGKKEAIAFRLDSFVSYNVDTRLLTLLNGNYYVHKDSEETVIRAYRTLDAPQDIDLGEYFEEFDRLKDENYALRCELAENDKHGFWKRFKK